MLERSVAIRMMSAVSAARASSLLNGVASAAVQRCRGAASVRAHLSTTHFASGTRAAASCTRRSLAACAASADADKGTAEHHLALRPSKLLTDTLWWSVVNNADLPTVQESGAEAAAILDREKVLRHVLIAADGSEASKNAVTWAADNLARDGDLFLLAHLISYDETIAGSSVAVEFAGPGPGLTPTALPLEVREELIKEALERNEDLLIGLAEPLVARGLPVEISVVVEQTFEDTAHVLSQVADDYNAECVVVGSTGKSWLERLFLGSVSHYLLNNLHHPVIVVPGGPEAPTE